MVTISDRAEAICAIEQERRRLWIEAQEISAKQMSLMQTVAVEMLRHSTQHERILNRMDALDKALDKLMGEQ